MKTITGLMFLTFVTCSSIALADIDRTWSKTDAEIDRFYGSAASERGAKSQYEALRLLRAQASECADQPTNEAMQRLGNGLRKLPRQNIFQVKERIEVYDLVQQTLLSIPGHARYFQQEIEREQESVKDCPTSTGPRVSYDFNRGQHFQTLAHLPSPETIQVLGHFLADDKDTPEPLMTPGSDWGENPRANSFASAFTLTTVGLRDAIGTPKDYDTNPDAQLAKARAWWEEVKAGRKTFSFEGRNVEYRFKADGTWETMAMVNPAGSGATTRPERRGEAVADGKPPSRVPGGWLWALVSVLVCLAGWLAVKRIKSS